MTVLVTGAGLVGTAFAETAIGRGDDVVFVDPEPRADYLKMRLGASGWRLERGDVRDLPGMLALAQKVRPTALLHTAGLIGKRVEESLANAFDINLRGTLNAAETVRFAGIPRLVHISTFGVYDWRRAMTAPVREDFARGPGRGYGNFKVAKEMILEAHRRLHGYELVVLRPANVYGVGHFWAGSSGGAKMQALISAGLTGETARIPATEAGANEYIYAKDVGRAVDAAVTAKAADAMFLNVGTGTVTPFATLIETAKRVLPRLKVEIEGDVADIERGQPLDVSAAKRALGWSAVYSLEEGLADYARELERARR
ncbi:MAG TPA: NAD(P)-dependent oxidoreductase [Alphaproteobacteria bacterium]|jgi:nucleoside-diphosphate-sugar epimerase|nr:NAD(P)-dependent oxidoreductase [Alphaproteobacteria bacterium]